MTDSNNDLVVNLLGALALGIADAQRRACQEAAGLEAAGPAALIAVQRYSDETVGFFDQILGLTSSGTVRLFDRLAHAGLIDRRPGADARTRTVSLTPTGQTAANAVRAARRSTIVEALTRLSNDEKRQLEPIAAKLLTTLASTRWEARHLCRLCDHPICDMAERCPVDLAITAAGHPRFEDQQKR